MTYRILHTEWSDGYGGQEMRIIAEMQEMRKRGHYVALATRDSCMILQKARELGFDTYVVPFSGKFDLRSILQLKKITQENNFQIINTHSGIDTWVGGLASLISNAKFIRTRHLSNKINSSRLNFINELADFIMTTGESVKEAMIKDNRIKSDKILSVPTGIDEERFAPMRYDKQKSRKKYNIPQEKIVVGFLGILRRFKRFDNFVSLAREIHKSYPNVYFAIGGGGVGKEYLDKLVCGYINENGEKIESAESYVGRIGFIDNPAEFLEAIDIFVLTSDSGEGVSQALMQALFMEKICIAADIGSLKDLYCDNNFILTDDATLESFIKALIDVLKKRVDIKINREFMVDNFSLSSMGNKIEGIYKRLLEC